MHYFINRENDYDIYNEHTCFKSKEDLDVIPRIDMDTYDGRSINRKYDYNYVDVFEEEINNG